MARLYAPVFIRLGDDEHYQTGVDNHRDQSIRAWVIARDGERCFYCGCYPDPLEADHIVPFCRGGEDSLWNMVASCSQCNRGKGKSRLPEPYESIALMEAAKRSLRAFGEKGKASMIRPGYWRAVEESWGGVLETEGRWGLEETHHFTETCRMLIDDYGDRISPDHEYRRWAARERPRPLPQHKFERISFEILGLEVG